jgi:hypothetical protein
MAALALEAARRFVLFSMPEASVPLSLLATVGTLVQSPSTYVLVLLLAVATTWILAQPKMAAAAVPGWMLLTGEDTSSSAGAEV